MRGKIGQSQRKLRRLSTQRHTERGRCALRCYPFVKSEAAVNSEQTVSVKERQHRKVVMKHWIAATLALSAVSAVWADDIGRVLSSTPVVQQVNVPRRTCSVEQVNIQGFNSGAGALLGAIAGGALGNASGGHGPGRAAATAIGMVGGAIIGERLEGQAPIRTENVQRCGVQNFPENRVVAYNVVYEFGGMQYSVQMPNDPGPTIAVQVSPVGSLQPAPAPVIQTQILPPVTSYVTVQPAPYYYPPVFVPFGFRGHWHEREHRHW